MIPIPSHDVERTDGEQTRSANSAHHGVPHGREVSAHHQLPDLMTAQEVAEMLRIPLPTLYYFHHVGKIPVIQIGGRLRFHRKEIEKLLKIVRVQGPDHLYETLSNAYTNKEGEGVFILPTAEHHAGLGEKSLKSEAPDIFVTDYNGPDLDAIPGLQEGFAGIVVQIIDANRPDQEFRGAPHPILATTRENLNKTLAAVREMIIDGDKVKKGENPVALAS